MDLRTQLYFLWMLVLANGHLLPDFGPPGHRDPGRPDILDPLHLHPHRGPFDHHPPGQFIGHHHRGHGMIEDILDPFFGDSNEKHDERNKFNDNFRVTSVNSPLKVNLLPETHKNNTIHENVVDNKPENKGKEIPTENNNTKPEKNIILPKILEKKEIFLNNYKNKNVSQPSLPAKEEQILRTNKNKTFVPKPTEKNILESKSNTIMPQQNTHSGDSIVFPDDIEETKTKFKDVDNKTNKTNSVPNIINFNVTNTVNMTKNRDSAFIPVQAVPVNPVQDTNGRFLLVPINPLGNSQNQALPITNDIFPSRSPVYTTVRPGQGPFYTSVVNAVPLNVQPSGTSNNVNNNNYQNTGVSQNPPYNSAGNNPNWNNLNLNDRTLNPNLSSNLGNNTPMNGGNGQILPNSVGIPTAMVNPNGQQSTINGYNNQPNYNNQQQNQYPARNLQGNGYNQETVSTGVVPTYNNVQGAGPQGIGNQNAVPNYDGNSGQTYVVGNVVPNNNAQYNPNGQQSYVVPNGNQFNNNNNGQPIVLNTQGNLINSSPNNGNNQQYFLVNGNQLNIPQNGQGNNNNNGQPMVFNTQGNAMNTNPNNGNNNQQYILVNANQLNGQSNNIYALQNRQLVALIPVQLSNGGFINNAGNQMSPVNGNTIQPNTLLPNSMNSQPNYVPINNNPNQPNYILTNGNTPNGAVLLNGQSANLNEQNSLPNSPVILNGQASNLNAQNSLPNGPIINPQNVLGNGQAPLVNDGRNLYTMVTVPNNYVGNVGGNSVPSSGNLVNTRDKEDKEETSTEKKAT